MHKTAEPAPAERTSTGAIDKPAQLGGGVAAQVSGHRDLKVSAQRPGEVAGDGVAVTVKLTNNGTKPIDLSAVLVDVRDSSGGSAEPNRSVSAYAPMSGSLAPGRQSTGTYVFVLPKNQREGCTILVRASAGSVVQLKGDL